MPKQKLTLSIIYILGVMLKQILQKLIIYQLLRMGIVLPSGFEPEYTAREAVDIGLKI